MMDGRRSFRFGAFLVISATAVFLAAMLATAASAQSGARMWQIRGLGNCIDVPNGNYAIGTQLIVYRCQSSPNQYFVLQQDGHFVANGGTYYGQQMCVDSDGRRVFLSPCRRLTTGDRQWWSRDGSGFIQNNHRNGPECIGIPDGNIAEGTGLIIRSCADNQHASWAPAPYSQADISFDDALRRIGPYPNGEPNQDPEIRSRWEESTRVYGPYHQMKDTRTGFCLRPGSLLNNLVLGSCGTTSKFHLSSDGYLREVASRGGYLSITGRCLMAPAQQGGLVTISTCNPSSAMQRWWVFPFGQVQNQGPGNFCLDVKNEARSSGAVIIGWPCDSRRPANQAFRIVREDRFPG